MTPNTQKLQFVRGDTFAFRLTVTNVEPENVTGIWFTCKAKDTDPDADAIFQKSLGNGIEPIEEPAGETEAAEGEAAGASYQVRVAPEDTAGAKKGTYAYDLQLQTGPDVYTLMLGTLTLLQDVTGVRT